MKEKFIESMKKIIVQFYGEDAFQNENYGKMINAKQFHRVINYLQDGTIVYGGNHDANKLFIQPTLLTDVAMESNV
ncbi:aldehyde dehydrogenase family protein, partial [Acinetobacter baumannii]